MTPMHRLRACARISRYSYESFLSFNTFRGQEWLNHADLSDLKNTFSYPKNTSSYPKKHVFLHYRKYVRIRKKHVFLPRKHIFIEKHVILI